jgi:hypothetical protein
MWSIVFPCLTSCRNYAILLQVGLLEVPMTYMGALGYFPIWGPVLPDGRPKERHWLTGGPVCAACLAWSYTISVHTPPPERYQLITGGLGAAPP